METLVEAQVKKLVEMGRVIEDQVEIVLGESRTVGSAVKSVTGGKLKADRVEVVTATGPFGREVLVQPLSGVAVLPGELHVWINGALRAPAAYAETIFSNNWQTSDDKELETWLRKEKFDASHLPNELKQGLTKMTLEWVVQVFPESAQSSRVVFTLGGIGGHGALSTALDVLDRLAPAVAGSQSVGPMRPLHDLRFAEIADAAASGTVRTGGATEEPQAPLSADEATAALSQALAGYAGKRVLIGGIESEKRAKNITAKVAKGVSPETIVAFIDTALRANGKAGLAFTEDTVHIAFIGGSWAIRYSAIRSVKKREDNVLVDADGEEQIEIPSGQDTDAILAALDAVTS